LFQFLTLIFVKLLNPYSVKHILLFLKNNKIYAFYPADNSYIIKFMYKIKISRKPHEVA